MREGIPLPIISPDTPPRSPEDKESHVKTLKDIETLALDTEKPRKKVLLIDGNGVSYGTDSTYRFEGQGITPFGLARLSSYLKKYAVPVQMVRLVDYATPEKQAELDQLVASNEIIGVSALSSDIDSTFELCKKVKTQFPDKLTIGGAEHMALDAEWTLLHPEVTGLDATCNGEGQIALLALALGISIEEIGGLSYRKGDAVLNNKGYGRLNENEDAESPLIHPEPAEPLPKEWLKMIFPELQGSFNYCGNAMTGSGCPFDCEFCTNGPFIEARYVPMFETAKKEIQDLSEEGIDFVFFRDAILNSTPAHFEAVIEHMKTFNTTREKPLGWFAFMSAIKGERHRRFKEMADAGCVMVGVGVEDVMGDRKKLGKGAHASDAIQFIDSAKEHLLVRTLLIMGLPDHYRFSRDELKDGLLSFMKEHPQAIFRLNQWTPLVGTEDFEKYHKALLVDPRQDPKAFRLFDTMHNVVDPAVMYDGANTPPEKRWVKDPNDWLVLRQEILDEYLNSKEYFEFVEGLKDKTVAGRPGVLYEIAKRFRDDTIS